MTVTSQRGGRQVPGAQPDQASGPVDERHFDGYPCDPLPDTRTYIFADVSAEGYSEIAALSRAKQFERGEMLCIEGDKVHRVYLLATGAAKTLQVSVSGAEIILKISRPGELIGGDDLFWSGRHSRFVQALQPCRVLSWYAATFKSLVERYPVLHQNLVRILGENLLELEERFHEVATEKVGPRLAHQLVRLTRQKSNGCVDVGLSREELAQMTGTTVFTVSRMLSTWQDKGWIRCGRNSVTICDAQALLALTG
jgi:CRP-like cAMP-binding protein